MLVAILGTTISPYLFFWQASLETEEIRKNPNEEALKKVPEQAPQQFDRIRIDTYVGMGLSNVVAFFIIVAAAATLNAHGIKDVQTSAQQGHAEQEPELSERQTPAARAQYPGRDAHAD